MKIEVLVPTMHRKDMQIAEKMNLQTDAIIINQTDTHGYEVKETDKGRIRFYSFAERGVGLSRNSALMRSDADICVLADDDMVFHDGYEETVRKAFEDHPEADVIIFNLDSTDGERRSNEKAFRVGLFNYMNYGAARVAFRRKAVTFRGVSFNLNFGGGTEFQCGEDTLFLRDCLKAGLCMVAVPQSLAVLVDDRPSTWFKGYTEKYLIDKGIVMKLAHPVLAELFCLYLTLTHPEYAKEHGGRKKVFELMWQGTRFVKNRKECPR
ncbi:MAG: glycosyltransferase [Clostridiales bacterium]|nr:glycosyltransferase [Clostridiales bacterium]